MVCCCVCVLAGFGEGDRTMREDREDRDAYRRMEGMLASNPDDHYLL